ncbi:hypothetical protein PM082_009723 [Marasmius tenuissimus]|nr:hypothetical protein PM082_009723 [Marasmius tenuissimus]
MKVNVALYTPAILYALIAVAKPISAFPSSVHPRADCPEGYTVQCCAIRASHRVFWSPIAAGICDIIAPDPDGYWIGNAKKQRILSVKGGHIAIIIVFKESETRTSL